MNNYDYNTLSGLRAAMVERKTAAQLKQARAELRKAKKYAKTK